MQEGKPRWPWLVLLALAAAIGVVAYPDETALPSARRAASTLRPPPSAGGGQGSDSAGSTLSEEEGSAAKEGQAAAVSSDEPPAAGASEAAASEAVPAAPRAPLPRDVVAFRRRVLEALARAKAEPPTGGAKPSSPAEETPGSIKDKTGWLGQEALGIINRELYPMLSECSDQALERTPHLSGMLAIGLSLATAEDFGGIVESVEAAPENEVEDEALLECLRQSAFTIKLPAESTSGHSSLMLTIPLGESEAD